MGRWNSELLNLQFIYITLNSSSDLGSILGTLLPSIALVASVFSIKIDGCSHRHRISLHKTPQALLLAHCLQVFLGSFWPLETQKVWTIISGLGDVGWGTVRKGAVSCNYPDSQRTTKGSTTSTSASRGKQHNLIHFNNGEKCTLAAVQ